MKKCSVLVPVCFAFLTGCAVLPRHAAPPPERPAVPAPEADADAYRLETLAMDISSRAKNLLYSDIERYAEQIFGAPETVAIPVPVFYLHPGESKEVDAREVISYPHAPADPGDPEAVEWREAPIGLYARAALELTDDGVPVIELKIEDHNPVVMQEVRAPDTDRHYRPISNHFSFERRAQVAPAAWEVVGGGSVPVERKTLVGRDRIERENVRVWRMVLVRLAPPGEHAD